MNDKQEAEYQEAADRLKSIVYDVQYRNGLEIIDTIGSLVGWDKLAAYVAQKQQRELCNG